MYSPNALLNTHFLYHSGHFDVRYFSLDAVKQYSKSNVYQMSIYLILINLNNKLATYIYKTRYV